MRKKEKPTLALALSGGAARCIAQIDATDSMIDALVYELYGLTEEEIGIVGS